MKRLSATDHNLMVAGDDWPLCSVTSKNSDKLKVAIIDLLTEESLPQLTAFDEIWYWKSELPKKQDKCRSIFDYKAENYWLWQKRAKELLEAQLSKDIEKRLKALYPSCQDARLLHLRMQVCTSGGDILAASRIGQFVSDRKMENVSFFYFNNRLHYIDDIVKESAIVTNQLPLTSRLMGYVTLTKAIFKLLLTVLWQRPILSREKAKKVDVLFFLDNQVQQQQMSALITSFRQKDCSLALVFHHPVLNEARPSPDPEIHVLRRDALLRATPLEMLKDFVAALVSGFWALLYSIWDLTALPFYEGAIRMNIPRLLCREVSQYFKAERVLLTGEYSREFNVWTTSFQEAGMHTELIIHGAAKAIYRHSFMVIDRLYVWGTAQDAITAMDSKVGEYVDLGPLYVHRVHSEALPKEEVDEKLIVVLSQHLDTLEKEDAGFDFKTSDEKFFRYVLAAAKELKDYTFLILPHPYEQKRGYVNALMEDELKAQSNIEISYDTYPFNTFRYIKHASLALTQNSASGYECLFSGGRCVFFDTEPGGYMSDFRPLFGKLITSPVEYSEEAWIDHLKEILSLTDDEFKERFPFRRYGANELLDGITSDSRKVKSCAE